MIQSKSVIKVVDNSGGKSVECITILKGFKKKVGLSGSTAVFSVKQLRNKSKSFSKVVKGEVLKGFILRTKKKTFLKDGSNFFFDTNCCVLLSTSGALLGTRVVGPVSKKYKKNPHFKWSSVSTGFF